MARVFGSFESRSLEINQDDVKMFFSKRAEKVKSGIVTDKQAVIYQDKSDELAENRDKEEKNILLPKLDLCKSDRFLDVGCGTGRWVESVAELVGYYHGTDFSEGLLKIAKEKFKDVNKVKFTCSRCTNINLSALGESLSFNKIIMFGVLIYLNDSDIRDALFSIVNVSAKCSKILLKEPVALDERLTIKNHFSPDMEQYYNAIYRTQEELFVFFNDTLIKAGFSLIESGDVYRNPAHNNRQETRQRYFLFER